MEIHPQNYENSKSCVTYLSVRVRVEKETLKKKKKKKYRSTFNGKIGAETQKKKQKNQPVAMNSIQNLLLNLTL